MMGEKSTRLPRRVFAMSSALALVALVWIGGGGQGVSPTASTKRRQPSSPPRSPGAVVRVILSAVEATT
jgi:hypothetical protein